jgi:hypothetical protein
MLDFAEIYFITHSFDFIATFMCGVTVYTTLGKKSAINKKEAYFWCIFMSATMIAVVGISWVYLDDILVGIGM